MTRYNPETHRRWYEANRERKIAQVKARYHADPDRHKAQKRRYRKANPIAIRVLNANWRAGQLGIKGTLTVATVKARLELWGWRCWQCRAPANIRPSCGRCNKRHAAQLMNETLGVISGR